MTETEKTIVVFRKDKKTGEIIALFPEIPADCNPRAHCSSFVHVGQHSAANYDYVISTSTPASEEDHKALKKELESAPYNYDLTVRKRVSYQVHRSRF